jgi:hypothetical protein
LLSGQSPFAATTAQGVLAAVLTRDPKPLFEVRKEVPKKLSAIIMSCLSKIPGGRPPHAEALLDALDMIATSSGEIRTREHKVPQRGRTPNVAMPPVVVPEIPTAETVVPQAAAAPVVVEEKKKRSPLMLAAAIVLLVAAAGAGWAITQKGKSTSVANTEAATPNAASMTTPSSFAAPGVAPAAVAVAPPVDSVAIANAIVAKRLADAEATKTTAAPVNADSLRRALQKQISDSIARANAQRAKDVAAQNAAAAKAAANTAAPANDAPAPTPAAPVAVAPAPAAAPAAVPAPPPSGKKRLAITGSRSVTDPTLVAFTRQFIGALRASLDENDEFAAIPQDEVNDANSRTSSRDEAAKILKPDVMVWPGYAGTGDTVNVIITVWDLRSSSSYGIRVTSAKIAPGNPEHYLGPLVQSTMKQLNDLANMPTIYRRK